MTPEQRFAALAATFAEVPDVTVPFTAGQPPAGSQQFGAAALKVSGSIFAMIQSGRLVVKLPRERVAALFADGTGAPFDSGKGTPMKEWLAVVGDDEETWAALAHEALTFVRTRAGRS
jgi:hypothetical protein